MAPVQQPLNAQVGQKTVLTPDLFDNTPEALPMPTPAGSTCTYAVDNPAVLTLTANPDGLTADVTLASAGTANVVATLTVPGAAAPFTATLVATVVAAPQVVGGFTVAFTPPA